MNSYNYNTTNETLEEVKNLISYSIKKGHPEDSNFEMMHRTILKKYFEARNVKINYEEQTIDLDLPVGKKRYTSITFECQELERFLKSCLKKDEKSLYFYQSLLAEYSGATTAA